MAKSKVTNSQMFGKVPKYVSALCDYYGFKSCSEICTLFIFISDVEGFVNLYPDLIVFHIMLSKNVLPYF